MGFSLISAGKKWNYGNYAPIFTGVNLQATYKFKVEKEGPKAYFLIENSVILIRISGSSHYATILLLIYDHLLSTQGEEI
jgi:hypothetical protein